MSNATGTSDTSSTQKRASAQSDGTSTRAHLMRKAQQCLKDREKYIAKLGAAQGNDVFKYTLLLNWIDCQGYVTEIQLQAHNSFRWSAGMACIGFCLLTLFAILAAASRIPAVGMQGIELPLVSGISGIITTFISSIFFYLYSRALKRLDHFHLQLREIQKVVVSVFLSGLIEQPDQRDQERKEIISLLLSGFGRGKPSEASGSAHNRAKPIISAVPASAS